MHLLDLLSVGVFAIVEVVGECWWLQILFAPLQSFARAARRCHLIIKRKQIFNSQKQQQCPNGAYQSVEMIVFSK